MCATQLQASCVSLERSSLSRLLLSIVVAALGLSLCLSTASAEVIEHDDGLPSAFLFVTTVQRGKPVPELDKQIRRAVVEHAPVHLRDVPPKKLSSLQSSARCRDESVPCMRAVARVAGVEVLLAATLERGSGELTLSIMAFDARADAVTRVAHWQDGSEVTAETYAALPNLLSALFPEPGPPDMDFVAEANDKIEKNAEAHNTVSPTDVSPAPASVLAPVLVAGGGALLVGAGLVTGLMLSSTQGDYSDRQVITRADAENADALRSRASTQASLANVFYGLGSVALVASGAWLAIELLGSGSKRESKAQATTLSPWVSPRELGLVLRHQGGGL
jgi:hypothetical protein